LVLGYNHFFLCSVYQILTMEYVPKFGDGVYTFLRVYTTYFVINYIPRYLDGVYTIFW
jgi:hypothetical protein